MQDLHFKIVMIGDSGVGKTALVNQISEGIFTDVHVPTVGSQFITLPLEIDKTNIVMELWDTAGQEVYRSLVGFYTREAKGAFLVFDVTSEESFQSLPEWITFVNEATPGVQIILFANKIDLPDRKVSADDIQQFAKSNNLEVIEGSAKTGENAKEAFELMGDKLLQSGNLPKQEQVPMKLDQEESGKKKKKCCK